MKEFTQKEKLKIAFTGLFIGTLTFLILYGLTPLNVTDDRWILQGYDELDIIQHYAGWLHFRNSEWSFPLMTASTLAYPTGTIVSFTDSIPLAAIVFKLMSGFLPETFQYFGIFTLLCYMLQGLFAALLTRVFIEDKKYIAVSVAFFTFAPILMERAFRHTGLGSQWLILAALYLYFEYRHKDADLYVDVKFSVLALLAIGIHPYFLPMVYGIYFVYVVEKIWKKSFEFRYSVRRISRLLLSVIITVAEGYLLGTLGVNSVGRSGYSAYSMNINALWNPLSIGGYKWSLFLAQQKQFPAQYDGFNYLGIGLLFTLVRCMMYLIVTFDKEKIVKFIKENIFIILISLCFTVFAISNVITFNSVAISIPVPDLIMKLCSIFRASGRIFYPVYYLIILFSVVFVYKHILLDNRKKIIAISLILCLQMGDMLPVVLGKHLHFLNEPQSTIIQDEFLKEHIRDKEFLVSMLSADDFELACFAGKNKLPTNMSCANTGDYSEAFGFGAQVYEKLINGEIEKDWIYVTTDPLAVSELNELMSDNINVTLYSSGRFLFVIPV